MRFGLLGPVAAWTTDGESFTIPEVKVRTLLAALLVHSGRPVSRDRLVDYLWGASPPAKAANALQGKVSQLRRTLESAEPGGRDLLVLGPGGYELSVRAEDVDANRFTSLAAQARSTTDPNTRQGLYAQALAQWRGPALADVRDEPFALATIARLDEERLMVLEEQAETRLETGARGGLTGELAELVGQHPRRERLRAAHMRALYQAGRQSEALETYQDLRTRLSEDLGVDPSPELVALHQAILEQRPELDRPHLFLPQGQSGSPFTSTPTPPTPSTPTTARTAPRSNLPAQLTALIGRDGALDEVYALLQSNRLVTLTGSGGVGKTRLAIAAASKFDELSNSSDTTTAGRSGGAWMVELSPAAPVLPATPDRPGTTADDVAQRVASALGIRDEALRATAPRDPSVSATARLAATLQDGHLLLVLDNCEHVLEPVADVVQGLLAAAPQLRVLATSREPLGVSGEALWTVPPLALPAPIVSDPELLRKFSAPMLFAARAADAAPGFVIDRTNAAAITAICRRLDGIPLALELAASRVRALGVHQLADRLDDRFRLLAAGKRGVPARQRTLRGIIDWSWDLLDAAEQAVLRRLAVHADGCTLAAAEDVCAGDGVDSADVPDILARLVDRSLVTTAPCDEIRYGLLESVAAYCLEQLDNAGETDRYTQRHRRYYLDLAERAESRLRGPDQGYWLDLLDAETANMRRALETAIRDGAAESALRLVHALAWYWFLRGRRHEAIRSIGHALALESSAPAALAARARGWRAGLAMLDDDRRVESNETVVKLYDDVDEPAHLAHTTWLLAYAEFGFGDLAASERLVDAALDTFRRREDRWGIAASHNLKANQAVFRGDLDALRRHADQSLALFADVGDGWGRLQALEILGTHAEITGEYSRATDLLDEAHRIAEELKLWAELSWIVSRRGRIALLTGDLTEADRLHRRGRDIAAEHSYVPGQEFADIGLAMSARRQGRMDDAEALLERWLAWNREVEAEYGVALILAQLGYVAELRGDADTARSRHLEGLAAAQVTGDVRAVALALEGMAGAESLDGRYKLAARLLGAAGKARDSVGAPLPPAERHDVERAEIRCREALGDDAHAAEFARGTAVDPIDLMRPAPDGVPGTLTEMRR